MIRNRYLSSSFVSLVAFSIVLTAGAFRANAQTKPFKISGSGPAPQGVSLMPGVPRPHTAVGNATELGKYYGEGFFNTNPAPGKFSSAPYFTFVAANGDKLVVTYGKGGTGMVTLTPVGATGAFIANFVAEFNPVPNLCTGRFKGVTGGWIMYAQSTPFTFVSATDTSPFSYSWQGEGTLTFSKK